MLIAEFVHWLVRSSLATSGAIVLVLLLRPVLQRWLGAGNCYALWLLVAAAWTGTLVPTQSAAFEFIGVGRLDDAAQLIRGSPAALDVASHWGHLAWHFGVLGMWLTGSLVLAARGLLQHRRFVRALGALSERADGLLAADVTWGLPAVIGLRPRIVVPADFDTRYGAVERALILAHERTHLARGDVLVNAVTFAFRCLYWFNPLAWWMAHRLRQDQELACDARVIAAHPGARRDYAQAMLKIDVSPLSVPLACSWSGTHPLKERITMLKRPAPSLAASLSGALIIATASLGVGWAAQPAATVSAPSRSDLIDVRMTLDVKGEKSTPRLLVRNGTPFTVRMGPEDDTSPGSVSVEGVPTLRADGKIQFALTIRRDDSVLGTPVIAVEQGSKAKVQGGATAEGPMDYVLEIDASADPARYSDVKGAASKES